MFELTYQTPESMVNLCSKVRVDFGELIFSNHINYEISLQATEVIKSVFHSCL